MKKPLLVVSIFVVLALTGFFVWFGLKSKTKEPSKEETETESNQILEEWGEEKVVMAGKYADADVVEIEKGKWRLYYALEPEVSGFEGQIYSAVSSDGISWTQEAGERMRGATFPSVIKLKDGRFRMYYQGQSQKQGETGIMSALSNDGLTWEQEDGIRIKKGQEGEHDTSNVAAPTVIELTDDNYLMIYRGSAGENKYGKMDKDKPAAIDYLISAVSSDGLNFTSKSVAVDSRNEKMREQIDGAELALDEDKIKLYCNSYEGVYLLELDKNGNAKSESTIIIKSTGPEYAPGDVAVARINNIWRMYFGLHTKGIYTVSRK